MTLSEFFLESARVAKMEEQYPDLYLIKYKGCNYKAKSLICYGNWKESLDETEFALSIVEGKPVFKGDKLYCDGRKQIAGVTRFFVDDGISWSWNPPKPKTVMLEVSIEVAKDISCWAKGVGQTHSELGFAAIKALGEMR